MSINQLHAEFENYRDQLKSYILRITASVADAEDIVQDTFLKAAEKIESYRGESSLKTWIFTIASNLAKDNLRAQRRWTEDVTDLSREAALKNPQFFAEAMAIRTSSPQGDFEIREHITFCFTCIAKSLPLEQQIAILLKEVYEFKVLEIAEILNITEAMAKYYLHAGRSKMIQIFEGRCALINKEGICHQCSELNGIFNPKQNTQQEIMQLELAKQAESGDKEHLFDLRMQIVKQIDPFHSAAAELQLHHLQHNSNVMENIFKKNAP